MECKRYQNPQAPSTMKTSSRFARATARVGGRIFCLAAALFSLSQLPCAVAQSAASGRIGGRIFNPATQQYVRNAEIRVTGTDLVAYSGDDGTYVLTNVPSG